MLHRLHKSPAPWSQLWQRTPCPALICFPHTLGVLVPQPVLSLMAVMAKGQEARESSKKLTVETKGLVWIYQSLTFSPIFHLVRNSELLGMMLWFSSILKSWKWPRIQSILLCEDLNSIRQGKTKWSKIHLKYTERWQFQRNFFVITSMSRKMQSDRVSSKVTHFSGKLSISENSNS